MSMYQAQILRDVTWTFSGPTYTSLCEFEKDLKDYQGDILNHASWDASELALLAPRVVIQCDELDAADEQLSEAVLTADNGLAFSAGELMFKVHNAFAEQLSELDHHFFEGFSWVESRAGMPVYQINLGS